MPADRRPVHGTPGLRRHAAPGHYARFDYVQAFDLGQDTDFEKLARLCPTASVNCILFPAWVGSAPLDEFGAELKRLLRLGRRLRSFSFSLYDVDAGTGRRPALRVFRGVPAMPRDGASSDGVARP